MVRIPSSAALLLACLCLPVQALTVFACEPEWAALVRELQPAATVHVATHAGQDPHHIEARPALIAQLRSADLALCTGAGLEAGWLPVLQQRAGNARVQDGAPGMLYASEHVRLIDPRPATLNPFAGDVHPRGNPHLHLDPERLFTVARVLAERLQHSAVQAADGAQAEAIKQRLAAFETRWRAHIVHWQRQAAALKGRRIAVQHTSFGYLWAWLGLVPAADLEPKPGLAPTPGHLQQVLQMLKAEPPVALVVASHQDARPARWVAEQLRQAGRPVPLLALPASPPDPLAPEALARWFDTLVQAVVQAAKAGAN